MNEDLQKLYDAVSQHFDIGTFDEFSVKMQTTEQRKNFYNAVAEKNFDLGDYDTYENRLKKKVDLDGGDGTSDGETGDVDSQEIVDPNIESEETEEKEESIFETEEFTGEYEINGIPISKEELLILLQIPGYIEKIKNGEEVITTTDPEFQIDFFF